ncbi:hypothetical protein MMC29_000384 [Sticta canariensis]|nr:hypothetical protein [Sticta canariensis]
MSGQELNDFQMQQLQAAEKDINSLESFLEDGQIKADGSGLAAQLVELVATLRKEHSTLTDARLRHTALEEKRMVYNAIGHQGTGYTGRGHWYQCSHCSAVYVVDAFCSIMASCQKYVCLHEA